MFEKTIVALVMGSVVLLMGCKATTECKVVITNVVPPGEVFAATATAAYPVTLNTSISGTAASASAAEKIAYTLALKAFSLYDVVTDSSTADIDAADYVVDITGSTVTFPTSGQANLTLVNNANGATLGTKVFGWIRSGVYVRVADPTAVNQWMSTTSGSATDVTLKWAAKSLTVTLPSGATSGTIYAKTVYKGDLQTMAAARVWSAPPCSGCDIP